MNYKYLNDFELCFYVQENDDDALELLLKKYKPCIDNIIRPYFQKYKYTGIELEDLYQEAKIGLLKASRSYDSNNKNLFITYAYTCIERQVISYCRTYNNMRNYPLNSSLAVDYRFVHDNSTPFQSVEDILIENEEFFENKNKLDFKYSIIYELRYNHFTYKEISILLDVPMSTVDGRLRYVRNMLNNSLNVSI